MWVNTLNPVLLDLGFAQIRWYGVVYVLGFFLCIWWLYYLTKKEILKLSKDDIWDLVFWAMVGVLVGSRIFEVFWEPSYYLSNPLNFFKFWQGGMSFHGGLVGIVVAGWLYCRKNRLDFWEVADALSFPTMLALALGRITNFINGELVGKPWNGSWCVIFPKYDQNCRHPQVLYGAAYRFLFSIWLIFLTLKHKFKAGFIFWNFLLLEGLGRLILDFFREDPRWFYLTPGQWFSLIMIGMAGYFLIKKHRSDRKSIFTT